MDRRVFMKSTLGATAGMLAASQRSVRGAPEESKTKTAAAAATQSKSPTDRLGVLLPTRPLGSTGEMVTIFAAGGSHIGQNDDEKTAQELIETALEGGVRFFDNAVMYQKGRAEEYFGKFLTPKYRQDVYIMTKTHARDAETAWEHLNGSLSRMKTDYLDLWQIHAIDSPEDVEGRLENGVLDVVLKAVETGRVRHIGFTGHRRWKAHRRMLELTDKLQVCQMPINIVDPLYESYIENVLGELVRRKMGVLAMKTCAYGKLMERGAVPDKVSLEELHFFVWSLPVSSLVGGFADAKQLKERLAFARAFSGLTAKDREAIVKKVADFAGTETESYKA